MTRTILTITAVFALSSAAFAGVISSRYVYGDAPTPMNSQSSIDFSGTASVSMDAPVGSGEQASSDGFVTTLRGENK